MTRGSILIIDGHLRSLKVEQMLLTQAGHEVRTALQAKEALNLLETYHPDIIITELILPDMPGLQLIQKLRSIPQYKSIIILAVTACAMEGDREAALQAGCD